MIIATTIDEVIAHLDAIIDKCRQQQSRIGYFACLYRKMTIAVKQGIANNSFADGKRMEMLDIIFANRYLQAWEAYTGKQKCTNAWCAVFDASATNNLVVLQHLILGINTHINLDLGIAAAEACPGQAIHDLHSDFNKINDVIASLMQNVQDDLSAVWPPLRLLASIANHRQDAVLNFSITAARDASWANALALADIDAANKENFIEAMDKTVTLIAKGIINPGFAMHFVLQPVLNMEEKNVSRIIDMLYE